MFENDLKADLGRLVLRVSLAALFLAHAGLKALVFGLAGTSGFFASLGFPAALGPVTIAWETAGAFALLAGIFTRFTAVALVPILLGAIITVHAKAGFYFDAAGGGWEFPGYWAITLVVLALLGPDRWSFDARRATRGER